MRMVDAYREHHVGTRYISRNYKKVLSDMEAEGRIIADPPAEKRRMVKGERSFADKVLVSFP